MCSWSYDWPTYNNSIIHNKPLLKNFTHLRAKIWSWLHHW
jgi:hypothetical protein